MILDKVRAGYISSLKHESSWTIFQVVSDASVDQLVRFIALFTKNLISKFSAFVYQTKYVLQKKWMLDMWNNRTKQVIQNSDYIKIRYRDDSPWSRLKISLLKNFQWLSSQEELKLSHIKESKVKVKLNFYYRKHFQKVAVAGRLRVPKDIFHIFLSNIFQKENLFS